MKNPWIKSIIYSKSQAIPHVHVVGLVESGVEDIICDFDPEYGREDWIIGKINCLHSDGNLKILLKDLAQSINLKSKKLENVDDLTGAIEELIKKKPATRIIFIMSDADGLSKFTASARNIILSIPKTTLVVRLVTISERVWELFETDCMVESIFPVQIHFKTERDPNTIATHVMGKDVEKSLSQAVVNALHEHTLDPAVIRATIEETMQIEDTTNIRNKIPEIFKFVEKKKMLSQSVNHQVLPIRLRLLILASYCATHNSPATDKRFFSKHHGKETRNEASELKNSLIENDPKAVDFQRLYFIYSSLCKTLKDDIEDSDNIDISKNDDIRGMISTLVSMGLIARASACANLDQPKYRCIVSFEYANRLASSVHIDDFRKYLEKQC